MIHNKKILQKWTQTTKARLGRHLQHLAWKRRGPILVLALHKFVTYSLTYLLRHLPTTGPTWGDHQWNHWCWRPMNNYFRYNQTCETNACSPTDQKSQVCVPAVPVISCCKAWRWCWLLKGKAGIIRSLGWRHVRHLLWLHSLRSIRLCNGIYLPQRQYSPTTVKRETNVWRRFSL